MHYTLLSSHPFARRCVQPLTQTTSALLASALLLTAGVAHAQSAPAKFVPFSDFVQSVRSADAAELLARPDSKVTEAGTVEQMRQHILRTYNGVSVSHSYVLESQTVDCIPISEQPSVRQHGLKKIAEAPSSAMAISPDGRKSVSSAKLSQLPAHQSRDRFGNTLGCEDHTIPMVRMTLEQLSRFKTLHEFFEKGPNGSGHAPEPGKAIPAGGATHKYAFTYEYVNNHGDNDNINLWRPYVFTDIGEVFSLAQSWTIGLSSGPVQTAEVGWQNYPDRTGTESSVPFIYFTADGYQNTGCYDLTCAAFVQVSNAITFGLPFAPQYYSVTQGPQYELDVQYYLYYGNWWLMVDGTWVGYYPGSVYNGGQLSQFSNLLEFGSESVGTAVWPAEGSGLFSSAGYAYSGYQRELWYRDTSDGGVWATLTASNPSPSCYDVTNPDYASNWGTYFYFGGPGGAGCQ